MDKYGYMDVSNKIRDDYDNIINKRPINQDMIIDGEKYTVTYPIYNLVKHYTLDILNLSGKKVNHGEVSAQGEENKVIRFYKGSSVVYEETL